MSTEPAGAAEPSIGERVLAAFEARYVEGAPFREDRRIAGELAIETRPVIESLLAALSGEGPIDVPSLEHHEALAMVTLLGRRAAALGATPTALVGLVPALIAGFEAVGRPIPEHLHDPMRFVAFEGYVAGHDERLVQEGYVRAADAVPIVRVAPRCLALLVAGRHEAELLAEIVDRFGRELLAADAKAGIVDLAKLEDPSPDCAAEVFGADAAARMLGATCVFSGVSEPWLEAARRARVPVELLTIEPDFGEALRRALSLCGLEIRRTSWLPGPIRTLLGPRKR